MGRLRNISNSFKTAAFPSIGHSSPSSTSSLNKTETPERPTIPERRDTPTLIKDELSRTETHSNILIPHQNGTRDDTPGPSARPTSMIYTPPTIMQQNSSDVEELKPVFSFLSSHANKLYQEGYFLKLDDLDGSGKPNANRVWTECFAQLVGTVLSFWDAEALDQAGQDGEVAPSFINLADASIKMIETLPTRNQNVQPLQNVLSMSTAGKNRYLLHFNSLHSLTQWTAGIRLAMFENASLQELYTGSLIAGKGKHLNSIGQILTKTKFRTEDWTRVRFGAGTPWRRCWCVIEPPDEKEWQKQNRKTLKKSAYEKPVYPKGDIKFYDTKKTKKARPLATITDAYSAYAIYPQSKSLINESTLIKLEGRITIHSQPESKTEGFVFVMPEVHPAVSGFEMMLRWLMPVYDTFSLYGRPNKLIPDTLDTRSLMFAMPKERRYGYLDIIDIASLIHTEGSDKWQEREWRKQMKDATSKRLTMSISGRTSNVERVRGANGARHGIHFSDNPSVHSLQSHKHSRSTVDGFATPPRAPTAPTVLGNSYHTRSVSETFQSPAKVRPTTTREYTPTQVSEDDHAPPQETGLATPPTTKMSAYGDAAPNLPLERKPLQSRINDMGYMDSANSSDSELQTHISPAEVERDMLTEQAPIKPVAAPPPLNRMPSEQPAVRPRDRPEMRREKSRMSDATLSAMNPRLLEQLRREGSFQSQNETQEQQKQAQLPYRPYNMTSIYAPQTTGSRPESPSKNPAMMGATNAWNKNGVAAAHGGENSYQSGVSDNAASS